MCVCVCVCVVWGCPGAQMPVPLRVCMGRLIADSSAKVLWTATLPDTSVFTSGIVAPFFAEGHFALTAAPAVLVAYLALACQAIAVYAS